MAKLRDPQAHDEQIIRVAFETIVADTGGGLFRSQIDLYWGEDDPMGPLDIFRPASCDVAVRWIVPVIVDAGSRRAPVMLSSGLTDI